MIHRLCEQLRDAQRILDVGTGTGNIALALAEVVPMVDAVDPSPLMLEVARSKAEAMNHSKCAIFVAGGITIWIFRTRLSTLSFSHMCCTF